LHLVPVGLCSVDVVQHSTEQHQQNINQPEQDARQMPDSAKRIKSNYQHNRNSRYATTKATDSFSQEHFKLPDDGHTIVRNMLEF
jgi:hypothetical protein